MTFGDKTCKYCGDPFYARKAGEEQVFCCEQCQKDFYKEEIRKKRMNDPKDRFVILKRDKFRCSYCGKSSITDELVVLHVDHVFPDSLGGESKAYNLITACGQCNVHKLATTFDKELQQEILDEIARRNEREGIDPMTVIKGM
jgi:5-methylcytosine-specific restriction endonuclease McrA